MSETISELQEISADAQTAFGGFTSEQINWKSVGESWSVGQCFEHLIKTNELFYNKLQQIANETHKHSLLENFSPFSGIFGNLLVNSMKKDARKFKAPTEKIVPPSEIDPNIIEIFSAHQSELIAKIKQIKSVDLNKIKVTSPFMKLVTYKLTDGFQVIVEHEKRHLRQAERVVQTNGFPN